MMNPNLKKKIENELKREVIILRQVIYKEVQEWKRVVYQQMLKVATVTQLNALNWKDFIVLKDDEKRIIDQEIQWFLFADTPDDLITRKAEKILEDIKSVDKLTIPQQDFKKQLEDALTIKSSTKVGEEEGNLPF